MKRMQIIAPTRSLFMAKQVIAAGADEIYLGLCPVGPRQISFDGRFQTTGGHGAHVKDDQALQKIVNEAHRASVRVHYCANPYLLPSALEHQYLHHVERGLNAGVDCIHVSSLQTLKLVRKHFADVVVTAGSQFGALNEGHIQFLAEYRVSSVVVSNVLTLDELAQLSGYGIGLVVRGNLESGGIPGYCRLLESPNCDEMGEGTRTRYEVRSSDGRRFLLPLLDHAHDCNLCNLGDLINVGVSAVKLLGREAPNPVTMAAVVALFRQWLDYGEQSVPPMEIRSRMEQSSLLWTMRWKPRFCDKRRCCHLYNVDAIDSTSRKGQCRAASIENSAE